MAETITASTATTDDTKTAPLFRVLKGNPSDAEIAALTAVLTSVAAAARQSKDSERNLWGKKQDPYRRDHTFNPNAFRNLTFY